MGRDLVLIVDDHDGFRRLARRMLESSGFGVADVDSGAAALRAARELQPELVLVDVQLPDIDGFEVAERLRRARSEATIVLTSTRSRDDYGPRLGESRFIAKSELSAAALRGIVESP